jgi:hypothetical protein
LDLGEVRSFLEADPHESTAPSTAQRSSRCHGLGMALATLARSTTRWRSWRCTRPRRPSLSCCGSRGRQLGRSWRASSTRHERRSTRSPGCVGWGSTRSPTSAATAT